MGWSKEKFLREADEIRSIIDARGPKKDIDATALSMLATQERMVRANTLRFEDMDLGSDHLIHGDLTSGNIFFDEKDQVKHIFDPEHTQYSARIMEIAKTLDFFCFRAETMKERFRRARVLLTEYHKIYPLIEQRLRDGLRAYFLRFVHYTWQCREYYKNNNERLRNVIVDDRERVVFLEQHLDDFIDQVIAEAFRNKMS